METETIYQNEDELVNGAVEAFRELTEKFVADNRGRKPAFVLAQNGQMVLVRLGFNDVPCPEFDSPLVRKLEREIKEKDESLEYWIREAKRMEGVCSKMKRIIERRTEKEAK